MLSVTFQNIHITVFETTKIKEEKQPHIDKCLKEMPCSHTKRRLKKEPQSSNFSMVKATFKHYTLYCSH